MEILKVVVGYAAILCGVDTALRDASLYAEDARHYTNDLYNMIWLIIPEVGVRLLVTKER